MDRWVNANITVLIPLDLLPDADRYVKQDAVGDAMERLMDALPDDMKQYVASGRWEDMGGVAER